MQKETLNLSAWEQIKEKVKRWFGKGEYGTSRDFLNLHKMRENSIDLEFLLLSKEFKENGLKKDVYGTQYDLKQEFKDFEERYAYSNQGRYADAGNACQLQLGTPIVHGNIRR